MISLLNPIKKQVRLCLSLARYIFLFSSKEPEGDFCFIFFKNNSWQHSVPKNAGKDNQRTGLLKASKRTKSSHLWQAAPNLFRLLEDPTHI